MNVIRVVGTSVPIVLVVLAAGCNNAKVKALANKAKAAATKGAETVQKTVTEEVESAKGEIQEQVQMAGKMSLDFLESPLETKACYARFVDQGSGRPTVFEMRSYRSPDVEEAPSVLFHAQIRANSLDELVGQVVSGRLFVQPAQQGPTYYSATGSPVEVTIKSINKEEKTLQAEILSGKLQNTQTAAALDATGTFDAVLQ